MSTIASPPSLEAADADYSASPLWNRDLAPTPASRRTWSTYNIAALWIGMSVVITTYTLASGLMQQGMFWWQAMLTILLGNAIVLVPMILNAHAGTQYGVSFPILCRASFGVKGANVPAMLRALVACGWFGIQTWIGGLAINALLEIVWPGWAGLGGEWRFMGYGLGHYLSFLKTTQGLADATLVLRRLHVEPFLRSLETTGVLSNLCGLAPSTVHDYIITVSKPLTRASRKHLVSGLRSFLRFAHANGFIERPLVDAVPVILTRKLDRLPQTIPWEDVQKLLAMPDRATTTRNANVQKAVPTSDPLIRKLPSANSRSPTITMICAGKTSTARPKSGVPPMTSTPAGTSRNPARLAEKPCTSCTKTGIR